MIVAIVGINIVLNEDRLDRILSTQKVRGIIVSNDNSGLTKLVIKYANDRKIPVHLYLPYPHVKKAKHFLPGVDLKKVNSITYTGQEYYVGCWHTYNERIVKDSDLILVCNHKHSIIKDAQKHNKPVLNLTKIFYGTFKFRSTNAGSANSVFCNHVLSEAF